jgi:hypothetical protein
MMRPARFRHPLLRKALFGAGLALGLALALPASAQQRPYLLWLDGAKLDIARIIGLPPAQNGPEGKAEFEQVQEIAGSRTPEREQKAIADQRQGLVNFLDGMGTGYVDSTHREVRLLFREAQIELGILLKSVHRLTSRQRPFQLWAKVRVKPCPGARPTGTSFPSAHAATAALYAELLKAALPEMADRLEERVKSYNESRLVCGFHFPSDLVAGDKVGRAVARALLAERAFRARFDETLPEIRQAFGGK